MCEIRYRKANRYVNDLASYTQQIPEAVFGFTIDELEALEGWVPYNDGFHKEVVKAKSQLLTFIENHNTKKMTQEKPDKSPP